MEIVEGYQYAVQFTRWFLVPFGLWPMQGSLIYGRCLKPILIILCISIMLFLSVPLCLYLFLIVKDIRIRIKLVGPIIFSITNLFKYLVVIFKREDIANCLLEIESDWRESKNIGIETEMWKNAKTGRMLTLLSLVLMYIGGMPYVTIIPILKGSVVVGNISYRNLPYSSEFIFFNPYIKPAYDIIFPIQCVAAFVRYTIVCGVYSIAIVCVMHICSKIAITITMLQNLDKNFDNKLLGQVVTQHLRFLRFAEKLEEIFKEIFLVDVISSICIICLVGYYFITEYEQRESIGTVTYFLLLMSLVYNIYILCYIGQILTNQCESMSTAAYMTDWYQLSGKKAKYIILIILCRNCTVTLTAGKMMILSLQGFTSVMKIAASYLNILRTLVANSN